MLDERRDGENGDNRRSDHDAVDNGLQRDVTQVVLAEIHHHGVVGIHGRDGKQRKQDNCSQVLVGENDLEIRAECARLLAGLSRSLLLGLSIDTDMLARSQKADGESGDATQSHDDSCNRIAVRIAVERVATRKEQDQWDERYARDELCAERTGLAR